MDLSKSILSAQYNNVATTPRDLGWIRGSGQFSTGHGMSSNWQQGQQPTYTREFPGTPASNGISGPLPNQKYELSSMAPVGERVNNKWKFTESQAKAPLKGDPYQQFALNDLNETPTALNMIFFNTTNVDYLQKRIVEDVFNITGIKVKPQDTNSLMVYMTNAYVLGHSGYLPTTSVVHLGAQMAQQRGPKSCSLKQRLARLNQTVLQQCVKDVLSGLGMYLTYYKDASSLPVPLERPTYMSAKGANVLQENIGLYSGNSQGIASFNQRYNVLQ